MTGQNLAHKKIDFIKIYIDFPFISLPFGSEVTSFSWWPSMMLGGAFLGEI